MYNVSMIDPDIKSYATEVNARKAVTAYFGVPSDTGEQRHCNVLIVRNEAGRYVPICINVRDGQSFTVCLQSGFMVCN